MTNKQDGAKPLKKTAREIAKEILKFPERLYENHAIVPFIDLEEDITKALEQKYKEGTEDGYDSAMYQQAQQREPWPDIGNFIEDALKEIDSHNCELTGTYMARWAYDYLTKFAAPTVFAPSDEKLRGAIARGYCHATNHEKELDADLLNAIHSEVKAALQSLKTIPADEYAELTRLRDMLKNGEKVNMSDEDPKEGE